MAVKTENKIVCTHIDLKEMKHRRNQLMKFDKSIIAVIYANIASKDDKEAARLYGYAKRNCTKQEIATFISCFVDPGFDQMIKDIKKVTNRRSSRRAQ